MSDERPPHIHEAVNGERCACGAERVAQQEFIGRLMASGETVSFSWWLPADRRRRGAGGSEGEE